MSRNRVALLGCILFSLLNGGCSNSLGRWVSGGWVTDYQTAEQRVRETADYRAAAPSLVIFYTRNHSGANRMVIEESLESPMVAEQLKGHVRCKLFKSHEPDRRYVRQFGVDRAPALILVHGDGTYHARTGSMSPEQMSEFIADAQPPGAVPDLDAYLPRRPSYTWHDTLDAAERISVQTGQPILVVYYRSMSRDWHGLAKMFDQREVYSRFADLVHCRIRILNPWAQASITRFGALKLPAVVILLSDGTSESLELPTSGEAMVHFADETLGGQRTRNRAAPASSVAGN